MQQRCAVASFDVMSYMACTPIAYIDLGHLQHKSCADGSSGIDCGSLEPSRLNFKYTGRGRSLSDWPAPGRVRSVGRLRCKRRYPQCLAPARERPCDTPTPTESEPAVSLPVPVFGALPVGPPRPRACQSQCHQAVSGAAAGPATGGARTLCAQLAVFWPRLWIPALSHGDQ